MSYKELLEKYHLLEISDNRIVGKREDIADYLAFCLNETLTQYLAEGRNWEETAPVLGDIWDYILEVERSNAEMFVILESPMTASEIIVEEYKGE